jgi:ribA/ribD-fused uncharacterized protein
MKITNNFIFFWDGWLSNFYPCRIIFDSKVFKSSEQLFMYLKALYFGDLEVAEKILSAVTPKEAKKLGRQVKNFDSKSWDEVKISKMYMALEEKFSQNKDLMDKLKDPILDNKFFVEASPFDRIWGIGYDENHALQNISDWGENLLGKTLTFYRGSL